MYLGFDFFGFSMMISSVSAIADFLGIYRELLVLGCAISSAICSYLLFQEELDRYQVIELMRKFNTMEQTPVTKRVPNIDS